MNQGFPEGVSVRLDEPIRRHSPWRTGGECSAYIRVHRRFALPEVLRRCRELRWHVHLMGAGTRTAFRDGGLAGAVVRLGTEFGNIEVKDQHWRVGAAVTVAALASRAVAAGLERWRPWIWAPGTVGAAALHDTEFASLVRRVVVCRRGREVSMSLGELSSRPPPIVEVHFSIDEPQHGSLMPRKLRWFEPVESADVVALMKQTAVSAARLRRVTLPASSPELFVNLGDGSAADLALLERSVVERVKRLRGVDLKTAVQWKGRV